MALFVLPRNRDAVIATSEMLSTSMSTNACLTAYLTAALKLLDINIKFMCRCVLGGAYLTSILGQPTAGTAGQTCLQSAGF